MDNNTQAPTTERENWLLKNITNTSEPDDTEEKPDLTLKQVAKSRNRQIALSTKIERRWLNSLGLNVRIPASVRAAIYRKKWLTQVSAEQLYEYRKIMRRLDEFTRKSKDF